MESYQKNEVCIRLSADTAKIVRCLEFIADNNAHITEMSEVLSLIANEVRLKILLLLKNESEICPCDMSDILNISIPAVSQHLKKLKEGNILESRRVSQTIYYSLKKDHISIIKLILQYFSNLRNEITPYDQSVPTYLPYPIIYLPVCRQGQKITPCNKRLICHRYRSYYG